MLIFPLSSLAGWPGGRRQPRPRIYSSRPLILLFLAHLVKDRQTLWISCHLRFNSGMCTQASTFAAASCLFKASFSSVCRLLLQFHERRSAFWRKSSTTIPLPQFERDIRNLLFLALLLYFYYRRDYTLFFNLILWGEKKSESSS